MTLRPWFVAVLVSGLGATACSSPQEDPARAAAEAFYEAVSAGDGAAACALLTPTTRDEVSQSTEKPCPQGLLDEGLPDVGAPMDVRVAGTMAQVRYGVETVFLARFDDDWLVMAAGCTPQPPKPYQCLVKGA